MKRALLWSIGLHGLLLLLIFFLIDHHHSHKIVGSVLKAHLMIEPSEISRKENRQINSHQTRRNKQRSASTTTMPMNKQRSFAKQTTMIRQGYLDALSILLHNKIQAQINALHYQVPDLLRNRMTKVCFVLLPAGNLKDIQFQQSTGVSILDQLAQQAIIAIQPVHAARKYLSSAKRFCMIFEFK